MRVNRKNKIISTITLFIMLFFSLNITAFSAAGAGIDWFRKGSVSIKMQEHDNQHAIAGAEMTLYKVADAVNINGQIAYRFTTEFENCSVSLDDNAAAEKLAAYVLNHTISGLPQTTDDQGLVRYQNLSLGLYLVVQTVSVDGFTDCAPFLVYIPSNDGSGWHYDIDATPKTDIVRLVDITVRKVWSDDGKNRPDSVKIQLLRGNTVFDTVVLNAENNWAHTWTDLEKSDNWSVKEMNIPRGYAATYKSNQFVFTVTNTATLIKTGQLNWPIPVLVSSGLVLFAIGWSLVFIKRKKNNA